MHYESNKKQATHEHHPKDRVSSEYSQINIKHGNMTHKKNRDSYLARPLNVSRSMRYFALT